MRAVVAHDVCAVMAYKNESLQAAEQEVIQDKIVGIQTVFTVAANLGSIECFPPSRAQLCCRGVHILDPE